MEQISSCFNSKSSMQGKKKIFRQHVGNDIHDKDESTGRAGSYLYAEGT